ncbi:MAG: DNA-binding transcriptional repressor PuuR [Planctomycetes bacterium ADurb.Bin401]|nr:MAG: DNA-binding transcriptional repressor PuuR [Planctomycetes bacterium ADurb.Bin401]
MDKYKARFYLGSLLAGYRQEAGLTLREAAEKAGVTFANLSNIERGRYSVGLDVLTRIAIIYGKKVDLTDLQD